MRVAEPATANWSGDGTTPLRSLVWSRWTPSVADGSGSIGYNDCNPSCAGGTVSWYPVHLHAHRPYYLRCGIFFSRVEVTYPGAAPDSRKRFTFVVEPADDAVQLYSIGSCPS